MSGVKKVSNTSRDRIRNMYVERKTAVNRVGQVNPVEPVNPVDNNTSTATANYMLYSELFYDTLNNLKEEYKRFYHSQRELEKVLKEFYNDPSHLYENMNNLIEKYNSAIEALQGFDHLFHTNHHKSMIGIVTKYEKKLKQMGIDIEGNGYFELNKDKFIQEMNGSKNKLEFITDSEKGLMTELYEAFRNIKIPTQQNFKKRYYGNEDMIQDYIGLLMDK